MGTDRSFGLAYPFAWYGHPEKHAIHFSLRC